MKTIDALQRLTATVGLVFAILLPSSASTNTEPAIQKARMIVLTDIENEPDDTESMVRLMLYSDVIDLQGLIATTSTHLKTTVAPASIRAVIRAYGEVRANLLLHDPNYPSAEELQALVSQGLPVYGMAGVGPGKDSEGSEWIIRSLEKNDDRPLWISVWGGANTLAQALHKLRATKSAEELSRLLSKLRIYTISDQDDSGAWIRSEFPNLFYIVSPGGYGAATWGGINQAVPEFDNTSISNKWLAENIQQGHGPLGAKYPDVGYGMEGDTPSWLNLIPNGLSVPERPDWGGWGGRYEWHTPGLPSMDPKGFTGGVPIETETHPIWTNAIDTYTPPAAWEFGCAMRPGNKSFSDFKVTVWRWRDEFQNDFAARMDWTTKDFKAANHPPVPALNHPDHFTVKSGAGFQLDARGTTDPDGDNLSYYWFQYAEAGSFKGPVKIWGSQNLIHISAEAPKVDKTETVHFILKVTDKGCPALTRYKRIIVTVTP